MSQSDQQVTVYDELSPCPYLAGQVARLPLRLPVNKLSGATFDRCLASGDRRSGTFVYRPRCPQCQACESLRIPVPQFSLGSSLRRTHRKGERMLETRIGTPRFDEKRLELFNAHRIQRGLDSEELDRESYESFLVHSCCASLEFSFYSAGCLTAVAVADRGRWSLSAVYCYYDPAYSAVSLGTYSILKQLDYCRDTQRTFLYLGYYIADSPRMSYKSRFRPHERLINGHWQRFD